MVNRNGATSLLTVAGVAELLNIHSNTVRRWSDRGIIRAYRIGSRGDRRFERDDIVHFLTSLDTSIYKSDES